MPGAAQYAALGAEELITELDGVSSALSSAYVELSAVKVQYLWLYFQGYKASQESSVSGRERDAEMASIEVKEDELRLVGNIDSLSVLRDLLVNLITWRTHGG